MATCSRCHVCTPGNVLIRAGPPVSEPASCLVAGLSTTLSTPDVPPTGTGWPADVWLQQERTGRLRAADPPDLAYPGCASCTRSWHTTLFGRCRRNPARWGM